jgi:hypothetical protein
VPYVTDFDRPSHDDVVWGNDGILPAFKQFDTANPPADYLCTLGDDNHKDIAAGYVFDGDIGWLMACYDHISELLDADKLIAKKFFKPGAPEVVDLMKSVAARTRDDVPDLAGTLNNLREGKTVPEGALCDNPHEGSSDAPPAVVGVFGARSAPKFLCQRCALIFVRDAIVAESFEPFELIPAGKKE